LCFIKNALSEEDKISLKIIGQNKENVAKKFLKEYPQKGWSLGGFKKLIKKIDTTRTAARRPGRGCTHC